jgi:hypothetical protein
MLGWSTAFLISLLSQIRLLGEDWLAPPEEVLETTGNRR